MYQQTRKGYKFFEQDDERDERRAHCKRCGAFLPVNPTRPDRTWYIVYDQIQYQDATTGEFVLDTGPRLATPEEIDRGEALEEWKAPAWTCRRCGCVHELDEMWL